MPYGNIPHGGDWHENIRWILYVLWEHGQLTITERVRPALAVGYERYLLVNPAPIWEWGKWNNLKM